MKTAWETLMVLLLLNGIWVSEEQTVQSEDLILQSSKENVGIKTVNATVSEINYKTSELETNPAVDSNTFVNREKIEENNLTLSESPKAASQTFNSTAKEIVIVLKDFKIAGDSTEYKEQLKSKQLASSERLHNLTLYESRLVDVVLKNLTSLQNNQLEVKDSLNTSLEKSVNVSSKLVLSSDKLLTTNLTESTLQQIVLEIKGNHFLNGKEIEESQNSTESSLQGYSKTIEESGATHQKQLNSANISRTMNLTLSAISHGREIESSKDPVHNLSDLVIDDKTKSMTEYKIERKSLNGLPEILHSNLKENDLVQIVLQNVKNSNNKQQETTLETSVEEDTTSTTAPMMDIELTTKPSITLEEYALRQMNFILDHLLLEIQEFVSQVLQNSVNSVFPRDNLKRYAEQLNRVLNPGSHSDSDSDSDSDYSDEIILEDKIYKGIVEKLNFLKSKSSKYLQKYLPQDCIKDFVNKKADFTIWLDKASEEMHREFNFYVTEEGDRIKYQYFNETFDDISRATELRHKLALLADLVKIVKNKKQITFMDLYMQT